MIETADQHPLALVSRCRSGDDEYDVVLVWCPAPQPTSHHGQCGLHMLPISGDSSKRPVWGFDGNLDAPTIAGSVLTHGGDGYVCHAFVRDGLWEFLGDCTHPLAGQIVPMVPLPDWVTD